MTQYRKKPVVIEAMQFNGGNYDDVRCFVGNPEVLACDGRGVVITTLEGDMTVSPGDWIIKGVEGEFYPIKPRIFAKTYEHADPLRRLYAEKRAEALSRQYWEAMQMFDGPTWSPADEPVDESEPSCPSLTYEELHDLLVATPNSAMPAAAMEALRQQIIDHADEHIKIMQLVLGPERLRWNGGSRIDRAVSAEELGHEAEPEPTGAAPKPSYLELVQRRREQLWMEYAQAYEDKADKHGFPPSSESPDLLCDKKSAVSDGDPPGDAAQRLADETGVDLSGITGADSVMRRSKRLMELADLLLAEDTEKSAQGDKQADELMGLRRDDVVEVWYGGDREVKQGSLMGYVSEPAKADLSHERRLNRLFRWLGHPRRVTIERVLVAPDVYTGLRNLFVARFGKLRAKHDDAARVKDKRTSMCFRNVPLVKLPSLEEGEIAVVLKPPATFHGTPLTFDPSLDRPQAVKPHA